MKSYRKRAKSSWRCGKGHKADSDARERQYSKQEIRQQLAEAEADYLDRHRGKRKRNERERLEYRAKWLWDHIVKYAGRGYFSSNYWNEELTKVRAKLDALKEKRP